MTGYIGIILIIELQIICDILFHDCFDINIMIITITIMIIIMTIIIITITIMTIIIIIMIIIALS